MNKDYFDMPAGTDIAWCPGCGNFAILDILKSALAELDIEPRNLVVAAGIGQAAKAPHYFRCNLFNGLHGRALPAATAIKAVNPRLTVIAEGGDGDMYGEGGNHFIHCIRRNPNITNIVHNNMVYGLTKGQASPTSRQGFTTSVQVGGVINEPFNPLAVAIALGASFVARCFTGDPEQSKNIIKQAIQTPGYALVDILQPCVTFNKVNTFRWFKERIYYLEESWNPHDRTAAFAKSVEQDRFPLGVLYLNPKPAFEAQLLAYRDTDTPVVQREVDQTEVSRLLMELGA